MKTIKQHIDDIKHLMRDLSDDNDYDSPDQFIYEILKKTRLRVLEQQADKHRLLTKFNTQTLCIDLTKNVLFETCDCKGVGCKVIKSTIKLPQIFSSKSRYIMKVTDVSGYNIGYEEYEARGGSRNRKILPKYDIVDGYLVIFNLPLGSLIKKVIIEGIFNNPVDLSSNKNFCDTNVCFDIKTSEFPIDEKLEDTLHKLCVESLYFREKIQADLINNENEKKV